MYIVMNDIQIMQRLFEYIDVRLFPMILVFLQQSFITKILQNDLHYKTIY